MNTTSKGFRKYDPTSDGSVNVGQWIADDSTYNMDLANKLFEAQDKRINEMNTGYKASDAAIEAKLNNKITLNGELNSQQNFNFIGQNDTITQLNVNGSLYNFQGQKGDKGDPGTASVAINDDVINTQQTYSSANIEKRISSKVNDSNKFILSPIRYGEIRLPNDFDSKGIKLFRNTDGKIIHNINFDIIENQSFDKILYFDTEKGNETTGDGTQANPYKTLRKCLEFITTSDLTKFKIYGKGILLRNEVNATQPATITGKTIIIIANNDDKSKISVSNSDGNHRTTSDNIEPYPKTIWTLENGIYKTTKGAVVNCFDKKVRNIFGAVEPMKFVANATECKNTPHSWTIVSGVTYVNTFDNREPDKDVLVCRTMTSTGVIIQNSIIYFKDFEFFVGDGVGGFEPYAKFDSGIVIKGDVNSKVYFVNCNATTGNATTIVASGGGTRGFKIVDVGETYMINCVSPQASNDNFSYTSNQVADVDKKRLFVFEYGCIGFNSGINNSGDNNQISTQHNGGNILRVNCNYWSSGGQVIADTGGVYSICVDCKAENSRLKTGGWNDTSYWFDNDAVFDNRQGKAYLLNCCGESYGSSINAQPNINVYIDRFPNYSKITKTTNVIMLT